MGRLSQRLPQRGWRRIWLWTLGVTSASMVLSVVLANYVMSTISQGMNLQGVLTSALMPVLMGGPMVFFMALRQQQLKYANEQLRILASTDGLTACLNRGAFTHSATHHLSWQSDGASRQVAFLVIDADDFKAINDHFGHDRGDEALQAIAGAIKANVRENDLVGRIGGEEFGVLLFDVSQQDALEIAERIRIAITDLSFAPDGVAHKLSVSIGGAMVRRPAAFTAIYRIADRHLYLAKQAGRDCVQLAYAAP